MLPLELSNALSSLSLPKIHYFDELPSTNTYALELLSQYETCFDGELVITQRQTAGRGRFDRKWISNPNDSLTFTLIIIPTEEEKSRLNYFSPVGALAVSLALEELGLNPFIKWPNDVLIQRKKICGILAETSWVGKIISGIALGIGINIGYEAVPPASEVLFPAACIAEFTPKHIDKYALLSRIIDRIFYIRKELSFATFIQLWDERLAFRHEPVSITPIEGEVIQGTLKGLNEEGWLRIVLSNGEETFIIAGDVKLRPLD